MRRFTCDGVGNELMIHGVENDFTRGILHFHRPPLLVCIDLNLMTHHRLMLHIEPIGE